jgi:hypothetical protein
MKVSQFIKEIIMNRRDFFKNSAVLGASATLSPELLAAQKTFPNFNPKIKRVIHLCMAGGMSQFESFDYKPALAKMHGKAMPESFTKGQKLAQLQGKELKCFAPQFDFKRHGQSGQMISDRFPHLGKVADELCVIRSMQTDQINHDPAHTLFNTGTILPNRPSMGAWINHALGSKNPDLPGYIVMTSEGGGQGQPVANRLWSSGFLPGHLQGVQFNSMGDAVHYIKNPGGINRQRQGELLQTLQKLNRELKASKTDPEIATRMAQYDLAYRMQASIPELSNMRDEPQHVLDLYGCKPGDGSYASNCLMARRMAERGVRFIQLFHRGWDHHGNIKNDFTTASALTDQGTAALISDLKQRGLLDDTLIIFGGEFGRTPMSQGGSGRDHHINAFSMFLAGGGVKKGLAYGKTDELGYAVAEDPVHIRDLHATILHLLGIDHHRLTYKFQGLDNKLTGVNHAKLVKGILS